MAEIIEVHVSQNPSTHLSLLLDLQTDHKSDRLEFLHYSVFSMVG